MLCQLLLDLCKIWDSIGVVNINIKRLHPKAKIPTRTNKGDAGYDLYALEATTIKPFERKLIKTGIAMAIPEGYYGRIAPRSGLALKKGIDVFGGTIDEIYRGDIGVILYNSDGLGFLNSIVSALQGVKDVFSSLFGWPGEFKIEEGDKVAQIVFHKYYEAEFTEVEELDSTARNDNGFGSSGMK